MLCSVSCTGDAYDALSDELGKLGWIEGTTIVIERKEAGSRFDRLPELAADLVRSKPDLIVAVSPQPARAVKDATTEIPIVILFVADPVGVGLASSLAHPGGNRLSVGFRSLGEAWCDTTTDAGRLMMTIMGGIAEFERSLIRSRTDAGIERARRQGKKFGRPNALDDGQKQMIADRYGKGATIPELADDYGVCVATIWRALQPETREAA
jgi:hypothetical protein